MYSKYIIIFITSLLFIGFIKKYAPKWGLIDIPNKRSSHQHIVPKSAGIGFVSAVFIWLPLFYPTLFLSYKWTILAMLLVFFTGILDDYYELSPNRKFLIIIIATILLSFDAIEILNVGIYNGHKWSLSWLSLPFTVFAVVGFTNALNLIDGLDGLSSLISIIILATFYIIGYQNNDMFLMFISGAFIVTLFAFLFYNWYPASIFMGDSGSLILGFIIAMLGVKSLAYIPAVSILYLAALPILDTVIVMIRRRLQGRSMVEADRCHIHHIFKYLFKENTPKTVIFLGILQMIYSYCGLQIKNATYEGTLLILFLIHGVFIYFFLGMMLKKQNKVC